jgi:hypothetical protein
MMPNYALCLYSYGWMEADTAPKGEMRVEVLLSLTDLTSAAAVTDAAKAYMQAKREHSWQVSWWPRTLAERPDRLLGSTVQVNVPTADAVHQRVVSVTMTEGDDGIVDWAAELNNVVRQPWEDAILMGGRLTGGTLGGTAGLAKPITGGW